MACLAFGVAAGAAVALSARRRARRDAPEEAWGQTSETTLRELSAVWRKDLLENVLPSVYLIRNVPSGLILRMSASPGLLL